MVTFYRGLNGKLVYGNSRIVVAVDSNGEVVHLSHDYQDIDSKQPSGKVKLKDVMEAFKDVSRGNAFITVDEEAVRVKINDIDLKLIRKPGFGPGSKRLQIGLRISS